MINDFTEVKSIENCAHLSARYTPSYAISFEGAIDCPYHFSGISTDFGKSACPEGLCVKVQEQGLNLAEPKSWGSLYRLFKQFGECDDGALGEGFHVHGWCNCFQNNKRHMPFAALLLPIKCSRNFFHP